MSSAWQQAKNILCIRLDYLGDVLMTTPAMRALRQLPHPPYRFRTSGHRGFDALCRPAAGKRDVTGDKESRDAQRGAGQEPGDAARSGGGPAGNRGHEMSWS